MRSLRLRTAIPLAVLTILASLAGCARTGTGGGAHDGGGVAAPWLGDFGSSEAVLAA